MQQRKFKRFLLMPKGIIIGVMQRRRLIRFVLLPIGIIGVLVISLVGLFSYAPDTPVPFPYIPPPEGAGYIQANYTDLSIAFLSFYASPLTAEATYKGQSFIFKNVRLGGVFRWKTETYISTGAVQFVAQDPSDLKELKEGDRVDIIGVCASRSGEYQLVLVIRNCLFLPAGLAPLPLPGGPVFVGGY